EQRIQQRDDPPERNEFASARLANVEVEIERLQQQHFIIKYIFGCNFSCPIENTLKKGARVLDGGCGPGAWLLEMATCYQNSQFFGIDFESHFPSQIKPSNANFFRCDLMQLELLEFEENSFDMVRICLMFLLISKDYAKVIEKMLRLLKPGGYFEIIETDVSPATCGPNFLRMLKTLEKGFSCEGSIGNVQTIIEKLFNANGQLKNVQRLTKKTKLGPPGGLAGELYLATLDDFFGGTVGHVMGKRMGMTSEEYELKDLNIEHGCRPATWDTSEIHDRVYIRRIQSISILAILGSLAQDITILVIDSGLGRSTLALINNPDCLRKMYRYYKYRALNVIEYFSIK
ncbi:6052_t:CDS:2, partial [Ambispora leptoticha]